MTKKLLFIILILILILGCKKTPTTDTTKVTYANEYNHGSVQINDDIYICGYQDRICPNDFSQQKPVCQVEDPDCI